MSWWTGPEAPDWEAIEWKEYAGLEWWHWCTQPIVGQQ